QSIVSIRGQGKRRLKSVPSVSLKAQFARAMDKTERFGSIYVDGSCNSGERWLVVQTVKPRRLTLQVVDIQTKECGSRAVHAISRSNRTVRFAHLRDWKWQQDRPISGWSERREFPLRHAT
ncbi:hypothetical protein, partial [Mesorhizobium sp. M1A.F.Ca.IN.022.07.1.1]|uniref:hypothetical protein n=1 Tax=Mesorhizobium sp. M1A.F.Ca.IN.022.07.1.1 TaxID=2496767 RepID=UPI0019D17E0E